MEICSEVLSFIMTFFEFVSLNVWMILAIPICLNSVVIVSTRPCEIDIVQTDIEGTSWFDEKGLLKFHSDDDYPNECEFCPEVAEGNAEGSEVCYKSDHWSDRIDESICSIWSENSSDRAVEVYSIRKFPNITGLKVLSVTKYKIEKWLNIDETFVGVTDLEYLYLESNHITGWSTSESQEPLTNLKVLSLANNPIANLSSNSFSWLEGSKLEYLNLKGCSNIKIIDSAVFNPLANTNHLWLDLSYTILEPEHLSNLTAGFGMRRNEVNEGLTVLSLAHTGLYRIPTEALENIAHSLERLSLQGNYFSNCWSTTSNDNGNDAGDCEFPTMAYLKHINLKDSGITDFPFKTVLQATPNLQALYLDDNPLVEMSCNEPSNVSYISLRNIKRNKSFLLCANGSKCSFDELKYLDLSNTQLNITLSDFSSISNLEILSLCNSLSESFEGFLKPLSKLRILDLSHNNLRQHLEKKSFEGLNNLQELRMQSSSIEKITPKLFEHIENLAVLDMSNNYLRILNSDSFASLQKLQTLILQENRIGPWKQPIFKNLPLLKTLNLRSNWLSDITIDMESDFKRLEEIDISFNPLSCGSCPMIEFFDGCINNVKNFNGVCNNQGFNTTLRNWNESQSYMCRTDNNIQKHLSEAIKDNSCGISSSIPPPSSTNSTTEISLNYESTSTSQDKKTYMNYLYFIIGIIPVGGVLCYWKRWNIIMFVRIFRRNMVLSLLKDSKTKEGKKESYQYDVFLSYSDRDREWILQQLIPNVEQRGHIKVCLHERDFQAGLPVLENIIACMDHSRCVLMVLSQAFLGSHWCQFELNLAQHRLLEMQHDRLILVLLENIPRDKCSKMLRYLMLTKTYLLWPEKGDMEEKLLFWRKLKKAIGPVHDTVNVSFA